MSRRALLASVLMVLALDFVSCATVDEETRHFQISETIKRRKGVSLVSWDALHSKSEAGEDGDTVMKWAEVATATLVSPSGLWDVSFDTAKEAWKASLTKPFDYAGSAVAVTEDGYFLTAAHCVIGDCDILAKAGSKESPELAVAPVRVVWQSGDDKDLDFALIHAPVRSLRPFDLADPAGAVPGTIVGSIGSSHGPQLLKSSAAGKVLSLSELRTHASGARYRIIECDVPVAKGDSGGPIFDRQANLLGVQREINGRPVLFGNKVLSVLSYRAKAVAPDWTKH